MLSVCHVTFPEITMLPGNSEVELPLQLSKFCHAGTAILEPAPRFMERHGILIAHSLIHTGPDHENTMVEDPDEVCTMTLQKGQEDHRQ